MNEKTERNMFRWKFATSVGRVDCIPQSNKSIFMYLHRHDKGTLCVNRKTFRPMTSSSYWCKLQIVLP